MKFLCVTCDEAMKLGRTEGPDGGSLTVIFACPSCGREVAMLTNAMETQMVRSLGVKIGGAQPAEPMEMVRSLLREGAEPTLPHPASPSPAPAANSGSKCPFAGVVAGAMGEAAPALQWTKGAEERIAKVPSFAQVMVRMGVEMHAREHGFTEVDEAVIDAVKSRFGM